MQDYLLNEEEEDESPYNPEDQVSDDVVDFDDDETSSDDDFSSDSEEDFDQPEETTNPEGHSGSEAQLDEPPPASSETESNPSDNSETKSFRVMSFEDFISK